MRGDLVEDSSEIFDSKRRSARLITWREIFQGSRSTRKCGKLLKEQQGVERLVIK